MSYVRTKWLDSMRPSDIRSHMADWLDHGFVRPDDMITAALDPKRFKSPDYGEFPEDEFELREAMSDHYEWFCNVFRIRAVWEHLAANNREGLSFKELDQLLLWVYRV